jgi:hypothetical protein
LQEHLLVSVDSDFEPFIHGLAMANFGWSAILNFSATLDLRDVLQVDFLSLCTYKLKTV